MNGPIVRLFGVIVLLFALLIVFTSRWTVFEASSLNNNPLNVRTLLDELQIKRGQILADDGTVLAKSVPAAGNTWGRTYPDGPLFAQPVGYSIAAKGEAAGLEQSLAPDLRGLQTGLSSIFGQLSPRPVGDDVYTTLDPKAQRAAQQALAGEAGSVVAIDPSTGAVKVMYANPTYNNNDPNPGQGCGAKDCLVNRVTQGQYAPGSTFKIVTADGGDRQRHVHPELAHQRELADHGLGSSAQQRRRPELGSPDADHRDDVLDQHDLRAGGGARRTCDDDRVHEAVRLLLQAAARLPRRADRRQPTVVEHHRQAVPAREPR